MTTIQIVYLSIITLIIVILTLTNIFAKDEENRMLAGLFQTVFLSILVFLVWGLVIINNELSKQLESKCPEYEKLENVYQLKPK